MQAETLDEVRQLGHRLVRVIPTGPFAHRHVERHRCVACEQIVLVRPNGSVYGEATKGACEG